MNKPLTFLLSLTFLFLFSGSVYGDDFQDAEDAYNRKDYKTAYKLLLPLAEQGDAAAQYNLGLMYYTGQGVPQDYIEAVKWYRLSAEQGYAEGQYNLGVIYHEGQGVGQGVPQDYIEGLKWYRLAAKQGFTHAQLNLGVLYHEGQGVPQDYIAALKWFRLAADQGFAQGQYNLGQMYHTGQGVSQYYKEAIQWFRLAAEQEYADAQHNLGFMYYQGQGVPQDYIEALKWFRLAAEKGIVKTQFILGLMYYLGQGVLKNYNEAFKWFHLAAEQEYADAQLNSGLMYLNGQGVLKDYTLAHMWFNLANSNGQKDALKNRNIVERRMTASQIDKAQQLAKNWKPNNRISVAESPPIIVPKPSIPQPPKSKDGVIATGTGFLFGSQDYIITNYHVVKGTSQIKVKFLNEEIFDAQVIAKDIKNDVAILKLNKTPSFQTREMKFGDSSMVRMGDKVFTIGYPSIQILGTKPKYSEGVISAVTGIQDNPTMFQTTVPILPGSSGSPLFNENGEVIGLTTGSLSSLASELLDSVPHNINYAVKSSFVKNTISTVPEALLSNRGIVVVPKESNSRSDFIEAISKNVVLILGKVN